MLWLRLKGSAGHDVRVGPAVAFALNGPVLKMGNQPVADQDRGNWRHTGHTFPAVETQAPTQIRFEDECGTVVILGPFERVQLSGSGIRCGHGFGEIVASYNERSRSWYEYLSRRRYPVVVFEEAQSRVGR
jgi:hypothetical protein